MRALQRFIARLRRWRNLDAELNRRVIVENRLSAVDAGDRDPPTPDECREMAIKLGVPDSYRGRVAPGDACAIADASAVNQRNAAWRELREIRDAIDADPEEATSDEVRRVVAERDMYRDMRTDYAILLDTIRQRLDVPEEPHPSVDERMLERIDELQGRIYLG